MARKSLCQKCCLPGDQTRFEHYFFPDQERLTAVTSMTVEKDGKIWLVRNTGHALIFDPGKGQFSYLDEKFGMEKGALSVMLTLMYCDRSNNIWMGTGGFGLLKYNLEKEQFKLISRTHVPKDPPRASYVASVEPLLNTQELLVSLSGYYVLDVEKHALRAFNWPIQSKHKLELRALEGGLFFIYEHNEINYYLYDQKSGSTKAIVQNRTDRSLKIQSVFRDEKGRVYFVDQLMQDILEEGVFYLNRWDPGSEELIEIPLMVDENELLSSDFGRGIVDTKGKIWLPNAKGSFEGGSGVKKGKDLSAGPE